MEPERLALRRSCRRVTAQHIALVTSEDIDAVLRGASMDEINAAMTVMAEGNKYVDVLEHADINVWRHALRHVPKHITALASLVLKQSAALRCSILEFMTPDIHRDCAEICAAHLP